MTPSPQPLLFASGHAKGPQTSPIEPKLIPLTKIQLLLDAGIAYPATVDGWRWLYRMRAERGLEKVFRRVGRRILVDTEAYLEAVRGNGA